jgi:transcription elongation factor GreB
LSKAFTREDASAPEEDLEPEEASPLPAGARNYMSPAGHARMRAELLRLLDVERPEVVSVVSWAASNGDRSENGDYLYGKKRLREIDRRIRFLTRRLDQAEVVDTAGRDGEDRVFFGATVSFVRRAIATDAGRDPHGGPVAETVTIVGIDEVDPARRRVSWISPIARALIKSREGDQVRLRTPAGVDELEIVEVRYDPID